MDYNQFLQTKQEQIINSGFDVKDSELNNSLFDFQRAIVKWAVKKGRAAIFADTGLGKTLMQTSWADCISKNKGGIILIFAPLAVAHQTVKEAAKFGIKISYTREMPSIDGIYITNYELLDYMDLSQLTAIILDESSILKSKTGKYRTKLIDESRAVKYKLSCTATPSPNDFDELGNQADFLGIMNQAEMLSMFFTLDSTPTKTGQGTSTWKLKGHGKIKFFEWMSNWACVIRNPSDLGFDGSSYDLPELKYHFHDIETTSSNGELFIKYAGTLQERRKAKRDTLKQRCDLAAEIVNNSTNNWIIWCELNDEQDYLAKIINDNVSVMGSTKDELKEDYLLGFADLKYKNLISKPSIAGFGLNLQKTHNMIFVSMSDSFERFYQAVRRQYRFGQDMPVNVHLIYADVEGNVKLNIEKKHKQHDELSAYMLKHMKDLMNEQIIGKKHQKTTYTPNKKMELPEWI